jgi:hypothetical protein
MTGPARHPPSLAMFLECTVHEVATNVPNSAHLGYAWVPLPFAIFHSLHSLFFPPDEPVPNCSLVPSPTSPSFQFSSQAASAQHAPVHVLTYRYFRYYLTPFGAFAFLSGFPSHPPFSPSLLCEGTKGPATRVPGLTAPVTACPSFGPSYVLCVGEGGAEQEAGEAGVPCHAGSSVKVRSKVCICA